MTPISQVKVREVSKRDSATRPIGEVVRTLREAGLLYPGAADGIMQLLQMGQRVARGAEVGDEIIEAIRGEQPYRLLYSLGLLASSARESRRGADETRHQNGWTDALMNEAARSRDGRPLVRRTPTRAGGFIWVPVDRTGEMVRTWVAGLTSLPAEATRRSDGSAWMTVAVTEQGLVPMPLDPDGVPLFALKATIDSEGMAIPSAESPPTGTAPFSG